MIRHREDCRDNNIRQTRASFISGSMGFLANVWDIAVVYLVGFGLLFAGRASLPFSCLFQVTVHHLPDWSMRFLIWKAIGLLKQLHTFFLFDNQNERLPSLKALPRLPPVIASAVHG
jgi:hypothetical protein